MALTYAVLASGSSGNCLWVKGGGVELLVDAGLPARRIGELLAGAGTSLQDLSAVVCTHGHRDHVSAVATLARQHHLEVWVTDGARGYLPKKTPPEQLRRLPRRGEVAIGALSITTVPTPHDAEGSVALALSAPDATLAVITDVGEPTPALVHLAREADALVLESNHDLEMLANGPYPRYLQERIRGPHGHLSNEQSATLLREALTPRLRQLTLAHLSEHNNTPTLARRAAEPVLADAAASVQLQIAAQQRALSPLFIGGATRQLELFG